jgi:hypothetical protein
VPASLHGNLRLAEVVLHGEKLGPSHPDVAARRPVAVLFDENAEVAEGLVGFGSQLTFRLEGAYAGGRCLALAAGGRAYPPFRAPFGHDLPDWDFEVAEDPKPGQYRHLQFAWRALDPGAKGIVLHLGGVDLYAGEHTPADGVTGKKVGEAVPRDWQVVRVDLWDVFRRPVRIRTMQLANHGGATAFDQILLGRTEKDLPPVKK